MYNTTNFKIPPIIIPDGVNANQFVPTLEEQGKGSSDTSSPSSRVKPNVFSNINYHSATPDCATTTAPSQMSTGGFYPKAYQSLTASLMRNKFLSSSMNSSNSTSAKSTSSANSSFEDNRDADMSSFLKTMMLELETRFDKLTNGIINRLDDMNSQIEALERNLDSILDRNSNSADTLSNVALFDGNSNAAQQQSASVEINNLQLNN